MITCIINTMHCKRRLQLQDLHVYNVQAARPQCALSALKDSTAALSSFMFKMVAAAWRFRR